MVASSERSRSSSSSSSPPLPALEPLFPREAAHSHPTPPPELPPPSEQAPSPTPSRPSSSRTMPSGAAVALAKESLTVIGELTPATWQSWKRELPPAVAQTSGEPLAHLYLERRLKPKGGPFLAENLQAILADEGMRKDFETLLNVARTLKSLVMSFGGSEASTKVAGFDVSFGQAAELWDELEKLFGRSGTGIEKVSLVHKLTSELRDWDSSISPLVQLAQLRLHQDRLNSAYRSDALLSTDDEDPHVISARSACINDFLVRDLLLAYLPPDLINPLLPHFNATTTLTSAMTAIQNLWDSRAALEEMETSEARRVGRFSPTPPQPLGQQQGGKGRGVGRRGAGAGGAGGGMRHSATKYAGFERWRGKTFKDSNGVERFKVPQGACFNCFQDGHFRSNCPVAKDPSKAAQRRVDELKKDGITVPLCEASALFVADMSSPNTSTLAALVAAHSEPAPAPVPSAFRVSAVPLHEPVVVEEEVLATSTAHHVALKGDFGITSPAAVFQPETAFRASTSPRMVLDSGATQTFVIDQSLLHNYRPFPSPRKVNGSFGTTGDALGQGTLHLNFGNRSIHIVNAMLVPFLGVNLLSMTRMMMAGIRFSNDKSTLSISDQHNRLITTIPLAPTLYITVSSSSSPPSSSPLPLPSSTSALFSSSSTADARLWHHRTGHLSIERMKLLEKGAGRGVVIDGWNIEDLSSCVTCARGKMIRTPVSKISDCELKRLEWVVSDVWGPSRIPGSKGARYLVGMIDRATRWMWVKPIRRRTEVAGVIQDWITRAERETGEKVKTFQSDQAAEYVGGELAEFLRRRGIEHAKSVAYVHGQAGVIERQWRTLLKITRCLLIGSGLPLSFWDLAAMSALHLRNRSPTSSLPASITPYQAYHGSAPNLSHLRAWGCAGEILIEGPSQGSKLEPKSRGGRFVGYVEGMKGWLFWVPELRKTMVVWSVRWFELKFEALRSEEETKGAEGWLEELVDMADELDEGRGRQEEEEKGSAIIPTDDSSLTDAEGSPPPPPSPRRHPAPPPPPAVPTPTCSSAPTAIPTRTSSRLAGKAPSHFVPLAGAPVEGTKIGGVSATSSDSELMRAPPAAGTSSSSDDPPEPDAADCAADTSHGITTDPIALSTFAEANRPAPDSRRQTPLNARRVAGARVPPIRPRPPPSHTTVSKQLLAYAVLDLDLDQDPTAEEIGEVLGSLSQNGSELSAYVVGSWTGDFDAPSLKEAMARPDSEKFRVAMKVELSSLDALSTVVGGMQNLVEVPAGKRAIPVKWVLVIKRDAEGWVIKYKARLVVRGDRQVDGVDFDETHSSTVRLATIRLIYLLLAEHPGWSLKQFDVTSAYLHGSLHHEIYIQQPPGFVDPEQPHAALRLQKALYGLRQGGREWQKVLRSELEKLGFRRTDADHGLYVRWREGKVALIPTHVDDGLIVGDNNLEGIIDELNVVFEGRVKREDDGLFLGMRVKRGAAGSVTIDQAHYARNVLERFGFADLNPSSTPVDYSAPTPTTATEDEQAEVPYRELLGALVYLAACTRPDLSYAISVASRFSSCPAERHWAYLKRICRFLVGTLTWGLTYRPSTSPSSPSNPFNPSLLSGWSDADHAADPDTRRSVSGFVFGIGDDSLRSTAISWSSRRQKSVSISSTEAEYIALSEASREVIWLRQLLTEIGFPPTAPTLIRGNNSGLLVLANHPTSHSRTKHIAVHYHFTRERVEDGTVVVKWIPTEDMAADLLTKGLGPAKHLLFAKMCGLSDAQRKGGCEKVTGDAAGIAEAREGRRRSDGVVRSAR